MRSFHWQPLESVKANPPGLSIIVPKLTWKVLVKSPPMSLWSSLLEMLFFMSPLHTWHPKSPAIFLPRVLCPVYFFDLEQAKSWNSTGKWTLTCCPRSSFGVCPTFQQTDICLLLQRGKLPGAAGWHPGSLDPCRGFSSPFLSPFSLCDSICPPRFNIYLTGLLWDPCLGGWGRKTHHSWISSSVFPNSVLTHPCWQKSGVLLIPFIWCQNLGRLYQHPTGWCEMWKRSDTGISALIPEIHEISNTTPTKEFCPTVPSHHQPPNHLFQCKLSLWIAKLTEEWCKCTFSLRKRCQCFLCHSPDCPTAPQEMFPGCYLKGCAGKSNFKIISRLRQEFSTLSQPLFDCTHFSQWIWAPADRI